MLEIGQIHESIKDFDFEDMQDVLHKDKRIEKGDKLCILEIKHLHAEHYHLKVKILNGQCAGEITIFHSANINLLPQGKLTKALFV